MNKPIWALLVCALVAVARPTAAEIVDSWTLSPTSPSVVESVQVEVPEGATADRPTEVSVFVGLPNGCHVADVQVEGRDEFTHVLRPVLKSGGHPCVQVSSFDVERVDLGYLPVGEHRVVVEGTERPVPPVTFWVGDRAAATAE